MLCHLSSRFGPGLNICFSWKPELQQFLFWQDVPRRPPIRRILSSSWVGAACESGSARAECIARFTGVGSTAPQALTFALKPQVILCVLPCRLPRLSPIQRLGIVHQHVNTCLLRQGCTVDIDGRQLARTFNLACPSFVRMGRAVDA